MFELVLKTGPSLVSSPNGQVIVYRRHRGPFQIEWVTPRAGPRERVALLSPSSQVRCGGFIAYVVQAAAGAAAPRENNDTTAGAFFSIVSRSLNGFSVTAVLRLRTLWLRGFGGRR